HAGLLSPQGKILVDFFVAPHEGGFLIDMPKESLDGLVKRLSLYKLRSDVVIEPEPDMRVAAIWNGTPELPDGAIAFSDPRLPELGFRVLLPDGVLLDDAFQIASDTDYHAHRMGLGVPHGGLDFAYGEAYPHEALFDQLHGVDFQKGCYVGQELVARMEYRTSTRRRIVPVEGNAPLETGAEVMAGKLPAGKIGSVDGTRGLAMLRLDRAAAAEAQGAPLIAGDTPITFHIPEFATFKAPVPEGT
ncbi:MAG: folate-binding protein, partial [Pseudomonadota bacterium]